MLGLVDVHGAVGQSAKYASANTFFERICLLGDFDTLAVALLGPGEGSAALACEPRTEGAHTPLSLCSYAGSIACCELLLAFGADPNLEANLDVHQTALMSAGKAGNAEVCQLLMRHGADPFLKRHDGATILDLSEPVARSAMLALMEQGEITRSTGIAQDSSAERKPSL